MNTYAQYWLKGFATVQNFGIVDYNQDTIFRVQIPGISEKTETVLVQLTGEIELVKYPMPEIDKSLKIDDFDFRFKTLNWVQQSESSLIKGSEWINPSLLIPEENSSSCTEAQKHALIALIIALVLFVAVTVASLIYYYNRVYDENAEKRNAKKLEKKSKNSE